MTLQSLTDPPGWTGGPVCLPWEDRRAWSTTGELRAMVTVRAMGGNRAGWFRVRAGMIRGGRGAEMVATVPGERVQATLEAVCGWAAGVAQ